MKNILLFHEIIPHNFFTGIDVYFMLFDGRHYSLIYFILNKYLKPENKVFYYKTSEALNKLTNPFV
jgi:hypothetical protein